MTRRTPAGIFLLVSIAVTALAADGAGAARQQLPLTFEVNQGQTDRRVKFLARGPQYTIFLTDREAVLRLGAARGAVVRLRPVTEREVHAEGVEPLEGRVNYLTSADSGRWVTNVPTFARVRYQRLQPGIDLVYYGNQERLEYDFEVAPGADPARMAVEIEGADELKVDQSGDLLIRSGRFELRWQKPVAYQEDENGRKLVAADYRVRGKRVIFALGPYDRTRRLVVDPTLVYSTYLGGSRDANPFNSEDSTNPPGTARNRAEGIGVDASGNAYVAGITSAVDFPVTSGAFDTTENGSSCSPHGGSCQSGFVTKLNATGSGLIYSTYFGRGAEVTGMALDSTGRVYITGWIVAGFSSVPTTANAFQQSLPCDECEAAAFLSVLNASGSGLVYSTLFGQTEPFTTDVFATDVAVGTSGVAYIVGFTNGPSMPTTPNAYQATFAGGQDAFLAKLNPAKSGAASLEYATYFGSPGEERAYGVATEAGAAYLIGSATGNVPTSATALDRTRDGVSDAFVTKIDTNQSGALSLTYSTLLGGSAVDDGRGIAVVGGIATVTGRTTSFDFPTTSGATQRTRAGTTHCIEDDSLCSDAFVARLNSSGSSLVYSTYLGGRAEEFGAAVAVDESANALVTGFTGSLDFPTTADALDRDVGFDCSQLPCSDAFLAKIGTSGQRIFSTALGGERDDIATDVARDGAGAAYLTGYTNSVDFPTSPAAFSRSRTGSLDAFIAKVSFAAGCAAPSTARTVRICEPADGATVGSPVHISAAARPGSSAITRMNVWVDGVKKYEQLNTTSIETDIPMTEGTHRVTVQAADSAGTFKATVFITVSGDEGGGCTATGIARTVTICEPTDGATVNSPVHIAAAARPGSSAVTRMNVWVDGKKMYEELNTTSIEADIAMTPGTHRVTVQAADASGTFKSTVFITVSGPSCPTPMAPRSVVICTPRDGQTYGSPVLFQAAASQGSSAIKRMELWIDGAKRFEVLNSNKLETSLALASGEHRVTVQAVDSTGGFKSTIFILVN